MLVNLISSFSAVIAGFMIFALFIMPMLKVDPEEYKEMMGTKQEALPSAGSEGRTPPQQRLQ